MPWNWLWAQQEQANANIGVMTRIDPNSVFVLAA
jgi:hypothetical protein